MGFWKRKKEEISNRNTKKVDQTLDITSIEKEILTKTVDLDSIKLDSPKVDPVHEWSEKNSKNIGDLKQFVRSKIPLGTDETIEFHVINKNEKKSPKKKKRKNKSEKIDKKYAKALELANINRYTPEITQGLDSNQVKTRIEEGFTNKTKSTYTKSVGKIIFDNLFTFFNSLMIAIAIILIIYQSYTDLFFLVIVIFNLVLGTIQEIRAKFTIDKLKLVNSPTSEVIRNGKKLNLDTQDVVLDDLLIIKNGDQIPTDGIVREGTIEVNEALLTGESLPIKKNEGDKILAGSFVVSGIATVQATSIGEYTFAGGLQSKAKKYHKSDSQLANSINKIIKIVSIFILPIAAVMGYSNYSSAVSGGIDSGYEAVELAVTKTAGSIVGMIPSGLILLTSVALFTGVMRLVKKHTYIQDLYSIERLARVDCLCLDKTGTLTDGSMNVHKTIKIKPRADIEEIMPNFLGAFRSSNQTSLALQNEFSIKHDYLVKRVLPFSSTRKLSGVTFEKKGTYVLGAPEFVYDEDDEDLNAVIKIHQQRGYRVLMLAKSRASIKKGEINGTYDPVALFILEDHIRKEAKSTVEWFIKNDVEIKVISGDSPITVSEIAKKVGIPNANKYVSLEGLSLREVDNIADKYSVFGRVTPEQKAQLVQTFKNNKKTVAMTGDGVNDILAMKKADCAIAMANGSEATKSVAHVVLLDSNFSSMPAIVGEGRRVINNIQLSASLFLMKTVFTIILSIVVLILNLFGIEMIYPFSPKNLMLMEIFIIGLPATMLALQPNINRVKGGFMANVLLKSLPGALALFIVVMACYVLKTSGFYGSDLVYEGISYTSVSIISMYFASLTVLYQVCLPFNGFRTIVYITAVVLTSIFTIFLPSSLTGIDVYSLNKVQWLVFLVLGFVSPLVEMAFATIIHSFKKIYEKQNDYRNKKATDNIEENN